MTSLTGPTCSSAGAGELSRGRAGTPHARRWSGWTSSPVPSTLPTRSPGRGRCTGSVCRSVPSRPRRSGGWVAAVERGFLLLDESWRPVGDVIPAPGQPDGHALQRRQAATPLAGSGPGPLRTTAARGRRAVRPGPRGHGPGGAARSHELQRHWRGRPMAALSTTSTPGAAPSTGMDVDPSSGAVASRTAARDRARRGGTPRRPDDRRARATSGWRSGVARCVRRYSPSGVLDRVVGLPVERVTSMAFGGAALDELFITTAREGLTLGRARTSAPRRLRLPVPARRHGAATGGVRRLTPVRRSVRPRRVHGWLLRRRCGPGRRRARGRRRRDPAPLVERGARVGDAQRAPRRRPTARSRPAP